MGNVWYKDLSPKPLKKPYHLLAEFTSDHSTSRSGPAALAQTCLLLPIPPIPTQCPRACCPSQTRADGPSSSSLAALTLLP